MSQLPIGAQAPDFELKNAEGWPYRLSEALEHGPVVLVFYKASCPTCQFTFPYIQRIFSRVGNAESWTLWAISEDDAGETRAFIAHNGIAFDVLIDEQPYPVSAAYGLEFVPAIFMVQPAGTIALSDFGFTKASLNQIAGFEFFTADDGLPASRPG